jgi:hypothetical protein
VSPALRATALWAVLLVLSGCAGSSQAHDAKHQQKKASPSAKEFGTVGKPAELTEIAAAIGCKANVITEADELRQGACKTREGQFTMVTFATDKGQHDWLSESKDYGGMYLVGKRWSVTGQSMGSLKPLRDKLGGSIEHGMVMSHGSHEGMETGDGQGGGASKGSAHSTHPEH